jgi:O-antigen ligase
MSGFNMPAKPNRFTGSDGTLDSPTVSSIAARDPAPRVAICGFDKNKVLLAGFAFAGILSLSFLALRYDVEPYAVLLVVLAAATGIVLTRKCLPFLIAGFLYVGNFKTTAAVGFSVTDPTFIILVLCCAGLLIECLLILSATERSSLISLFAGQSRGVLLFVIFVLSIVLSQFYTAAPESGVVKAERIAVFGTLAFFAPFVLFRKDRDLRQFLIACVVLSLALAIRNLVNLFHPTAAVLAGDQDITHIGDGELIATAIVILIYQRLFRERRILHFAGIATLAIGLVASAARSVGMALLAVLAISPMFLRSRSGPRRRRRVLLGVFVIMVAAAAIQWIGQLPAARLKLAHKEDELGHLLKGSLLPGGTVEQRVNFYRQSLVAIGERPLLGWGVGGWGAFFLGMDKKEIPHNFILESAVEQGLIGCGTLLAFLIATGAALRKTIQRSGSQYAFLAPAFLLPILTGLVTGGLDNRLLWFWCGTIFAICRMVQYQLQQPRAHGGIQIH